MKDLNDLNTRYTYKVIWSEEDNQFVGLCAEFPSLSWLADTEELALQGILKVVVNIKELDDPTDEAIDIHLKKEHTSGTPENAHEWKLFRCMYDEMGMYAIEGEGTDGRFEKALAVDYAAVGWLIGQPVSYNGMVVVKVILEGEKEVLQYVLNLIGKDDD